MTYIQFSAAYESNPARPRRRTRPEDPAGRGPFERQLPPFMLNYLQSQDLPDRRARERGLQSRVRNVMHIGEKDLGLGVADGPGGEVSLRSAGSSRSSRRSISA
ncbi:MAG: hypothetical protein R3E53_10390 [Myxococcota bacterium]